MHEPISDDDPRRDRELRRLLDVSCTAGWRMSLAAKELEEASAAHSAAHRAVHDYRDRRAAERAAAAAADQHAAEVCRRLTSSKATK